MAIVTLSGRTFLSSSTRCLMPSMMASVDTEPFFSTCSSTERPPSTCTMLVCGGLPSRTWATSRRKTMAPLAVKIGRSASAAKSLGALLSWMAYS